MGSSVLSMTCGLGQLGRVLDADLLAGREHHVVDDARRRGDEVEVELALEALLDDLHVEEPEKPTAEAEAERLARVRFEGERRVVHVELLHGVAERRVLGAVGRVDPGEDHGLHVLEAGERVGRGTHVVGSAARRADGVGHRVAELHVVDALDVRGDEADLSGAELVDRGCEGLEDAHLGHFVVGARHEKANLVALLQEAVDHADHRDRAAVGVVPGVEREGAQEGVFASLRRRDLLDDLLEDLADACAGLTAGGEGLGAVEADDLLDLRLGPLDVRARQVDLVEDREDLEALLEREIDVRERLRLDALGGVDDEDRALAGREAPRHLVVEVDVAGRVDEVELVDLPVRSGEVQADRLRLDRDPALALDVHLVEELRAHLALGERTGDLEDAVGERGFSVIDVRDDREIADRALRGHGGVVYLSLELRGDCGETGGVEVAAGGLAGRSGGVAPLSLCLQRHARVQARPALPFRRSAPAGSQPASPRHRADRARGPRQARSAPRRA